VVPYVGREHDSTTSSAPDNQSDSQSVFIGILAGLTTVLVVVFAGRAWTNRTVAHLRILRIPPGEAPEDIRRAWVGVALPLSQCESTPRQKETMGVLSNQEEGTATGYAVGGRKAVNALETQAPDAASWWRENASHVLAKGYQLFFPLDTCERVA
jgi:hypothetical protein